MGGKKGKAKAPQRKKGKSGNPAKRAEQERAAAQRSQQGMDKAIGSAFGGPADPSGAGPAAVDPSTVRLPPGFEKFLGS
jgi:signal recognition particle subunit SRP54